MAMRMFTAVLPPAEVVHELDSLLEARRGVDPSMRWTRPEGWHLTTSFMGHVPLDRVEGLEEHLLEVARSTEAFEVRIEGGLAFPNPMKARIVGLAVPAGEEPLAALSARCRTAAVRAGVEVDGARFTGHLTLARHNRGLQATKWLTVFDSFPGWEWTVDELSLVESLGKGRGYEVTARFPLRRTTR